MTDHKLVPIEPTLVEGKFYRDHFKTDPMWHGPMRRVAQGDHEMWLDQWGANYLRDGTHWGHTPESASNLELSTETDTLPAIAAAPASGQAEPVAYCDENSLRQLQAGKMATVYGTKRADEEHHEHALYASPPPSTATAGEALSDTATKLLRQLDTMQENGKRSGEPLYHEESSLADTIRALRTALTQSPAPVGRDEWLEERLRKSLAKFLPQYEPWMDHHADDVEPAVHARYTFGDLREAYAALRSPSKDTL